MIKLLIKGLVLGSICMGLAYLMIRNGLKVKRVEKFCDKLREDQRMVLNKAVDCDMLISEFDADNTIVYNKFKPLCYQVELGGDQTIFLCKAIDDKSFLFVSLYGDRKLIPLNYKLEINRDANKVKIYGQSSDNKPVQNIMIDFSRRLKKYWEV